MAGHKVLITTSGIGSRLGKLTSYTNKCLVRVGDIPAISHIIQGYPKETEFVITLGHYGDYVKQFLELVYEDRSFTFVKVDKYQGEGSSLGYSILQCKDHLQCPFIFHASDTIIPNFDPPSLESNWCVGAFKKETSQYRTLKVTSDNIEHINEKGELNFDLPYVGICGISDYALFWKTLSSIPNQASLSDVHVINSMLEFTNFKLHKVESWLDIGNTNELEDSRRHFKQSIDVLDKDDESIFFFENFVVKFFSDSVCNQNRVARANLLTGLVPEVTNSTSNFFKYKKAEGNLFSKSVNTKKFLSFLNWCESNLWQTSEVCTDYFKKSCYDFYLNKTISRIEKYLCGKEDFDQEINGVKIPPVLDLVKSIDIDWLCEGYPSRFHGDFILDNIIETNQGYTLIDWRQDFAGSLEVGDVYYDLAKLNHNLTVNHEIVSKGYFSADIECCNILCNSTLLECKSILHSFIEQNGYDLKKVKVLTALIWINMSPLHEYPFNKFLFNFGKYHLSNSL